MDLKNTTPPCLYSCQKSYLLKLLNDKLQKLSNINLINDNIRNINENGNRISLSTKKSITKRHVDLLVAAEDDISQSQSVKYLQTKLGNELILKSRNYECDTIILPSPSDIDYENRLFEWWNNSSRLAIIPLSNQQLGIHSIQYIPKHSALGMERNSTNSLHFVNKIHTNLRDNGVDSVIDIIRQYVYSRNRIHTIAHSQISYDHELKNLFIPFNINNNNTSNINKNNTSNTSSNNNTGNNNSANGNIVAIGGVAHSVDPTLFQRGNVAIHDAIQLCIQLNEHGLTNQALQLYEQDSKLSFERINKYSEGMARIGFKKRVNKVTILFKFIFEKLNIMRFKRIVSKVNE
ncbi:predicted protein [Naegleria gruberi]|uniref:Predicted protein n=1 Tax=Naegleria gruberi TaxID=5762 RepID=D2V0K3_NAEGR|nr:uncharacterized protein NAEGRDRAFT_62324 [Naegleria gruberi]EFC49736.1 predicted protein [Naegleria gruberi]|eukprot:XP_002682480.1 predicted protein [Naegleria gruberi strain NEG-M]